MKKISFELETQRFCIGYRPHSPMPAFSNLISITKKVSFYYIKFSSIARTSCLNYINSGICSELNWPAKLFIRLVLVLYDWGSKSYKNLIPGPKKSKSWSYKKARRTSTEYFIIKASFTYQRSSALSLSANIIMTLLQVILE